MFESLKESESIWQTLTNRYGATLKRIGDLQRAIASTNVVISCAIVLTVQLGQASLCGLLLNLTIPLKVGTHYPCATSLKGMIGLAFLMWSILAIFSQANRKSLNWSDAPTA